jgi:AmmeMemoRadiSam system protein A
VIDPVDRSDALALVRAAIAHELGGPRPVIPDRPFFREVHPAFVTLHRPPPYPGGESELHGCIGSFAERPFGETVQSSALSAAYEDPRATALAPEDLDGLDLEISLLSPSTPIDFASEEEARAALRPGVDGVILRWRPAGGRPHQGLFLPQVWQSLPEPRAFLDQLKRKAGLPTTFWAPDVTLERFTVEILHDLAPRLDARSAARAW